MGIFRKIFAAIVIIGFQVLGGMLGGPLGSFLGNKIGAALGVAIGSLVGAVVARGLDRLLFGPTGSKQESAKYTVRISEPTRWVAAGRARLGGAAIFGEYDYAGNFWQVVIHGDSIMTDAIQYYLDDMPVTLDGSGNVTTNDFCLTTKGDVYAGSGTRVPYIQIKTTTYSETNPTPPAIAMLAAAFPTKWTSDHKLVGTTYSVVKCKAVKDEWRNNIYRWRGPFGMGEPGVSIVADWSNVYDPRDVTQTLGDRSTYKPSRNAALIWAWWRTHPYGRRKSESSINWTKVAEQANICDQTVTGISGTHTRYTCDVSAADDRERSDVEEEILRAFDAQIMFDSTGKAWPRAGYYYAPTVTLHRNRDIMAMETMETQTGESDTQGVIVRYTDPASNWSVQPSAPWVNDDHYIPGQPMEYLTVDVPTISDHNQAMRIAKAIGKRMQSLRKVGPTTGLRGLKLMSERIVDLSYDNVFSGDYEIIAPVEMDNSGLVCRFVGVPVDSNRWTLLEGEESSKPANASSMVETDLTQVEDVVAFFNGDKIKITYTPSAYGARPMFEYRETSSTDDADWVAMTLVEDDAIGTAWSGPIFLNLSYDIRYRNVSPGGRTTSWIDPVLTLSTGLGNFSSEPSPASAVSLVSWGSIINLNTPPIPRAAFYEWSVWASDGTTLKRTITTSSPTAAYTLPQATADGVARSYKVSVVGINNIGAGTASAQTTITKPALAVPTSIAATDGALSTTITYTPNGAASGNVLFYSDTAGFNPKTEGRVVSFGNTGTYKIDNMLAATYFFKMAAIDGWTTDPDFLNLSDQYDFTITTGGGGTGGDGGGWEGGNYWEVPE